MIISRLIGGLANQMFQYAAGLSLAYARRTVLKLDVAWYREQPTESDHVRYALNCFNILEQFATASEVTQLTGLPLEDWEGTVAKKLSGLARRLGFHHLAYRLAPWRRAHRPETFAFYPQFFELPDDTYLNHMFQSEQFFAPIAELLRCHFTFRYPPGRAVAEMLARISSSPNSIAVHLRYGDYRKESPTYQGHELPPLDYYNRGETLIRERHPDATLFIFSDEIRVVAKEYQPLGDHVFVDVTSPLTSFDDLRLMAACKHAIIANSTFSWWGAWLAESAGQIVVAPSRWFTNHNYEEQDILPTRWTKLPRTLCNN